MRLRPRGRLIGCGVALVGIVLLIGFLVGGIYNNLVGLQEGVDAAWANVENVYQRRTDLIPNLVETVKGAAEFEQETLLFLMATSEYQEFLKAGGYQKPEYWKEPFTRDGKIVEWEEATSEFVDKTGRPGPAGWELGAFTSGEDQYPVSGVSWYEALGVSEPDKRLRVFEDSGHIVPRMPAITETLDWLDRYLGPVERTT